MTTSQHARVRYLVRPEGRIAYEVTGNGPLIVAVPGMGDLRGSYRELVTPLVDAGFRVAVTDLRGHGDSDTSFHRHGDAVTAADLLALIDELGGPALVIGNSMGGSAGMIAAADRPDAVAGLVLLSPFARELSSPRALAMLRVMYLALFARPWGAAMWASYYAKTLNKGAAAPWLAEHVAAIRGSMSDAAHLRSFRQLATQLDHRQVAARIADVTAPALVLVGELDPDYPDAAAETAFMIEALHAQGGIIPNAAHYVHTQRPDLVVPRVLEFAIALRHGARWEPARA